MVTGLFIISECGFLIIYNRYLIRGLLYVTVLKIYISNYGYLFGTAMYVDYSTFSHLNPITNPTPC
jgi:hypothetical protein